MVEKPFYEYNATHPKVLLSFLVLSIKVRLITDLNLRKGFSGLASAREIGVVPEENHIKYFAAIWSAGILINPLANKKVFY